MKNGIVITEGYPKRMLVWNDGEKNHKKERTVLCMIIGCLYPVRVVSALSEVDYINNEPFSETAYHYCKPIPEVQKMTVSEICKELGREIEIVK
jgi:hypothetical protein